MTDRPLTRLEFFDKGHGLAAVKLGFMSPRFLWIYNIYKTYQGLVKAGWEPSEARQRTKMTLKEKYLNVARAIYWFEREDWIDKKALCFRNAEKEQPKALVK